MQGPRSCCGLWPGARGYKKGPFYTPLPGEGQKKLLRTPFFIEVRMHRMLYIICKATYVSVRRYVLISVHTNDASSCIRSNIIQNTFQLSDFKCYTHIS